MKTRRVVPRPSRTLKVRLASIGMALLVAAGLFMAGVFLPPLAAPVRVLNAPSAAASGALSSPGVNGTLASFTALFPEIGSTFLPVVAH